MNVKRMMVELYIAFVSFQMNFTNGFLFNKKNRDITNAIISASFSPLFDNWIKQFTDSTEPSVTNILEVVEYPEKRNSEANFFYLPESEHKEVISKLPNPFSLKNNIYKLDTSLHSLTSSSPSLKIFEPSHNIPSEIIPTNDSPIYDPPIYDIINSFKPIRLPSNIDSFTNNEIVYYIIKKDHSLISNNDFSLKLNNYEGIFLVTGEVIIIILLFSILTELQKFTYIQKNNLEK